MLAVKIYICENKKIKFQNALFTAAKQFAGLWKIRKKHCAYGHYNACDENKIISVLKKYLA